GRGSPPATAAGGRGRPPPTGRHLRRVGTLPWRHATRARAAMIGTMPPSTPLADEIMDRLSRSFEGARDPQRAVPMAAYMRDQFPFLGIPGPTQKMLTRSVLAGLGRPSEADLRAVALACWQRPEREYQYFACGWLRRHARTCGAEVMDTAPKPSGTTSCGEPVETLADHVVGTRVSRRPQVVAVTDAWIRDPARWPIRSATLPRLTYQVAADADRLFRYCA